MTFLLFVLGTLALFALLAVAEGGVEEPVARFRQTGLIRWLRSGNWPAKVGAGLLLLGIGALLRYALLNLDLPPPIKLGGGLIISAGLAAAAFSLRNTPARRGIHVALAGTAAGVAYLTAYSAYGFFGYVSEFNALAMLALVALGTGVYAVNSNVMSIAILAMIGAYIAPAFALKATAPGPVYGYYCAISALCLVMVSQRGWRGLIHLSFLFTLAGSLFFGWTSQFYRPAYYPTMQPILLVLAAIHLAMPLAERKHIPTRWLSRFDVFYFAALPVIVAALTLLIAPAVRNEGALGLGLMAILWGATAGILAALKRDEAHRHATVAALLLASALFVRMQDAPWLLISLAIAVAGLASAARAGWSKSTQEVLGGAILLLGLLNITQSLFDVAPAHAFISALFLKRLCCAGLLLVAAAIARRRALGVTGLLSVLGSSWLLLAIANELVRLDWIGARQVVFAMLLAVLATASLARRWRSLPSALASVLVIALSFGGWWVAGGSPAAFSLACLTLTPVVLAGWVVSGKLHAPGDKSAIAATLALLPLSVMPWANGYFAGPGMHPIYLLLLLATLAAIASLHLGRWYDSDGDLTVDSATPVHFVVVALALAAATLLHIERGAAAMAFEIAALAYLWMAATSRDDRGNPKAPVFGLTATIASVLVMQAMLLRLLGPDRIMNVTDLGRMNLPAVVSLLWAALGGGLTWFGATRRSRHTWAMGSALLVVAAIKLVLLDFGSLGQLGNILALIASGGIFLGVAWLAPMPPRPEPAAPAPPSPPSGMNATAEQSSAAPAAAPIVAERAATPNRAVFAVQPPTEEELAREREAVREAAAQAARAAQAVAAPDARATAVPNTSNSLLLWSAVVIGAGLALILYRAETQKRRVEAQVLERIEAAKFQAASAERARALQARDELRRTLEQEATQERNPPAMEASRARATERQPLPQVEYGVASDGGPAGDTVTPKIGQEALDEALRAGKIRPGTPNEVDEWRLRYESVSNRTVSSEFIDRVLREPLYLITDDFTIPDGLNGANAVVFILEHRAPYPRSKGLSHSILLDLNTGACQGILCRDVFDR